MFNGLTGYSTKPPAPIGLSVYPTTLRRRLLVSQVPRRNPSGPGAGPSAAVAPKGSSSAVSSGTPRNRAPAAALVSPVNLRILYSMKPLYTDKFLSQIRKFFRDIYEKIIYNIIKEQVSVLEIK